MLSQLSMILRPKKLLKRRRRQREIKRMAERNPRRVVVGASGIVPDGWIGSEAEDLDLLNPATWKRFFADGAIDAILAEHVWEHLTEPQGRQAAQTCFRFLKPGGYLRAAVPDGFHPDPQYIEWVRPGGVGAGADDHKVLYDHAAFRATFESAGFDVELLEFFDERGDFHFNDGAPEDGLIRRSKRFDSRNKNGRLGYTSLVLDAKKPSSKAAA